MIKHSINQPLRLAEAAIARYEARQTFPRHIHRSTMVVERKVTNPDGSVEMVPGLVGVTRIKR